jgi:FtsP/CotA-like multicopper oxidase with cupredoxin domain
MIIYGPKNYNYDIDLGPVLLTDWSHKPYYTLVENVMTANLATSVTAGLSDNNLINGKNNFNCSSVNATTGCSSNAGLSKFYFTPGKYHRLRLINAGAEGLQHFSIDNHSLEVIAADFVPMVKSSQNVVPLGIGQRMDVIVYGSREPGQSYWMRSTIQTSCSGANNPDALAVIYYPDADETHPPTSQPWTDDLPVCQDLDPSFLQPFFPSTPLAPAETHNVNVSFGANATGHWLWSMNGVSYRGDYNAPALLVTKGAQTAGPYNFSAEYNAFHTDPGNDTSQVVMFHLENEVGVAHPIHYHGHNMYLISQGTGAWNGTQTTDPNNPPRRDVYMLPASGHLVFSYNATNPGAWPMHCHIAFHVSAGLFLQTVEQSEWIQKYMNIPASFAQQCREWWDYSGHEVVRILLAFFDYRSLRLILDCKILPDFAFVLAVLASICCKSLG